LDGLGIVFLGLGIGLLLSPCSNTYSQGVMLCISNRNLLIGLKAVDIVLGIISLILDGYASIVAFRVRSLIAHHHHHGFAQY
jgi:hypothetical protein